MTITLNKENKKLTVLIEGWLDTVAAPELGKVIDAAEDFDTLVFDFEKLEYISSSGLRQVAAAYKKCRDITADFSIINANKEVMSIFELTALDKKIKISAKN